MTSVTKSDGTKSQLKAHHHIWLTKETRQDLQLWLHFLHHPTAFSRPFIDFSKSWHAEEILFYTDSSRNARLGCGGWCEKDWFFTQWLVGFVESEEPSNAYLELYALAVGVTLWIHRFSKKRIIINRDNQAVVQMVNNSTSGCQKYMILIRKIVLHCLVHNVKIFIQYIESKWNLIADALSRIQLDKFKILTSNMGMNDVQTPLPMD